MADLGDLSDFLKEGSVADLDWLDVDDKQYRELDKLPKQNLDIAPDLQAVWDHKDKPAGAYLVPNKDKVPAMADLSQAHAKQASAATEQLVRVARYSLMQSNNVGQLKQAITSRFDSDTISNSRTALASVLGERGLLGRFYIAASDFSDCAQGSKKVMAFVRRYAADARFVVAKSQCQGCVHNSGAACGVFRKKIVLEVPYSPELANAVEQSQASKGKQLQASTSNPRDRIKAAYLAGDVTIAGPAVTPKPIVNPVHQLRATKAPGKVHLPVIQSEAQRLVEAEQAWQPNTSTGRTAGIKSSLDKKGFEVANLLRREMLKGRGEAELIQALKLSFTVDELKVTKESWVPLMKEAGFYGTVYATQTSFDDCTVGADFLAKHNPSIKAIVTGSKCNGCIYNKMSRCLMYGRPLVATGDAALTADVVRNVIWEHRLAGKLETGADKIAWGPTPKEALKAIYRVASKAGKPDNIPMRSYVEQAFRGAEHAHVTAGLTKREIVKTATRYLNEGLYGAQLGQALKRSFDPRDIVAAGPELKLILAEQGLQGIYYVNPMAYDDYGRGCDEGSRLHRARLVPYVKLGSKCGSCVLQTSPGHCSKYAKPLVVEPPYADKKAQQQEILNSGKATEVSLADLMINNKSIVAEFGMKSMTIDLNPVPEKTAAVTVELGGHKIDL
jgi:hypothetical protein